MKKLILLISLVVFNSCDFMDDAPVSILNWRNQLTMVNATQFENIDSSNYNVENVVLTGNCLEITISSNGCNPNNWDMNFIVSEMVVETNPVEYKTKVELINKEDCLSVFQKTVSFNLNTLQISGSDKIQINIQGWKTPIIYHY